MQDRDKSSRRPVGADQRGATAIEYAILAALIILVILTAVQVLGANLGGVYGVVGARTNVIG